MGLQIIILGSPYKPLIIHVYETDFSDFISHPTETNVLAHVGSMLRQRLRRWRSVESTLGLHHLQLILSR